MEADLFHADGKTDRYDEGNSRFSQFRQGASKVKVTLVRALRLCTGRTAHRGNRGIALLLHDKRH